jgi:hypothetical protein
VVLGCTDMHGALRMGLGRLVLELAWNLLRLPAVLRLGLPAVLRLGLPAVLGLGCLGLPALLGLRGLPIVPGLG